MSDDPYRELARQLDGIPNGFPSTPSGVEQRLLAKLFTPEEASVACVMRLKPEPAAVIAGRAGLDAQETYGLLRRMAARGLIEARKVEGQRAFALRPFVVGFYEAQLTRMDDELADLVEQYFTESRGGILRDPPSLHRVIPVGEAIPFQIEIFPYERASELLEGAKSWGVRNCICRVQQHLVGKGCERPVEACLVFAPVEGAFEHSEADRPISKEEALDILASAAEAGLVHSTGNFRSGTNYICNCCTCCCGILRGISEFDVPTAVAHSAFQMVVEPSLCIGCGDCVDRCQFGALTVPDDLAVIDEQRCMGCGQCVLACTVDALFLERRPAAEIVPIPDSLGEWMAERGQARGLEAGRV